MEEVSYVYKTDAIHIDIMLELQIFTNYPFLHILQE